MQNNLCYTRYAIAGIVTTPGDTKGGMMDHPTFGRWLKLRRRSLGLTQTQLAEQISYAGETIRKVEADELRPSRQMAEKLATALEIAPEERTTFIRFARDEALRDEVALPLQINPPSLPPPPRPSHVPTGLHLRA